MVSLLLIALLAQSPDEIPVIPGNRQASTPRATTAATPAPADLSDGEKALDENRFEDAIAIFDAALTRNSADLNAHFNLALAHSMMGNDADAIPHYKAVLAARPEIYEAKINLGQVLLRSGDAPAAGEILRAAVEQMPTDFRASYFLAEALSETGQFAEAAGAYQNALLIEPRAPAAEFGYGRALAAQDDLAGAETHYRAASAIDPSYKDYLLELGQRYEQREELASAIRIYREFPDKVGVRERIGILALELGRFGEATVALESAVAESPTRGNRLALAQAYMDQDQPGLAEPIIAALVKEEPDEVNLRMVYARLLRDRRDFGAAARQFQTAADLDPALVDAWGELAGMLILDEKYVEALVAFERLETLGGAKPGHLYFRAVTHDRLQQREQALKYYSQFLAVSQEESPDQEFLARQRIRALER